MKKQTNSFLRLTALLFVLSFATHCLQAQLPNGYGSYFYKGMRYGLFIPPNYNPGHKYPIIVYLHGRSDTVSWNQGWYNPPVSVEDPCFVITPKSIENGGSWGSSGIKTHSTDMKKTLELMDSLMQVYTIDKDRLYIHGTSMGGYGVFSVLAKEPGKFAGAYVVCGGGTPDQAENIQKTPLWIFHGDADNVVNIRNSKVVYDRLVELGDKEVRFTVYPGVGHDSWRNVNEEKTLPVWLLKQKKGVVHQSPEPVKNAKATKNNSGGIRLEWAAPDKTSKPNNEIWYYKILRDGLLIGEIDGTTTNFTDTNEGVNVAKTYSIVGINFYFKEAKPVQIKL